MLNGLLPLTGQGSITVFRTVLLFYKMEREKKKERAAGSGHRFLAVGIDFRWREIALLAAALGPLAYLAAALAP